MFDKNRAGVIPGHFELALKRTFMNQLQMQNIILPLTRTRFVHLL